MRVAARSYKERSLGFSMEQLLGIGAVASDKPRRVIVVGRRHRFTQRHCIAVLQQHLQAAGRLTVTKQPPVQSVSKRPLVERDYVKHP